MRVAVLADSRLQRHTLRQALVLHGHELVLNAAPDALDVEQIRDTVVDVWIVSLQQPDDLPEVVLELLHNGRVPVLIDDGQLSVSSSSSEYPAGMRSLLKKLASLAPAPIYGKPERPRPADAGKAALPVPARHVWLLAASLGGPAAVKTFLENLPTDLPLGFVYAQHIPPGFDRQLPAAVGRHADWMVRLAREGERVMAGEVVVVPADRQMDFDADGQIMLTNTPWPGSYAPSIDRMMRHVARSFGTGSGAIFFSGMGDDGSDACHDVVARGMLLWTQSAASCASSAMPDSIRATGLSSYTAEPRHLALALLNHARGQMTLPPRRN